MRSGLLVTCVLGPTEAQWRGLNVPKGAVTEGENKEGHHGGRAKWRFVAVGGSPLARLVKLKGRQGALHSSQIKAAVRPHAGNAASAPFTFRKSLNGVRGN